MAADEHQDDHGLAGSLLDAFAELGGVELDLPPRTDRPRVPS